MALFWLHPTPFPGLPHTCQHPCLAFAPAVLPALDTHLPIPKSEDLILQDPKEFPKDPTPSTMSLPLYAVYFSKDLGSHLTPPPALLPQGTKVREDGDNNRKGKAEQDEDDFKRIFLIFERFSVSPSGNHLSGRSKDFPGPALPPRGSFL